MTTVIVTGVPALHAAVSYHHQLGRYLVELSGEGVTVEFVLTEQQVRRLLAELRAQERKVGPADVAVTAQPQGKERAE